ncbi:MAG TPA: cytochrome c [Candidatus Angelobacter sp.]|nr:cytochrome c [Candidatus Angelobacter sp.]
MSNHRSRSRTLPKILFAALLAVICVLVLYWATQQSKPWVVPEEFKQLKNPLVPSASNLDSARQLYRENCVQCHGQTGKGDGPEAWMQKPAPADLADAARMATVTDGEMFYQITEGRRPMPSFKSRLTQDQRWQLVLLLRTFSQPASASTPKETAK